MFGDFTIYENYANSGYFEKFHTYYLSLSCDKIHQDIGGAHTFTAALIAVMTTLVLLI